MSVNRDVSGDCPLKVGENVANSSEASAAAPAGTWAGCAARLPGRRLLGDLRTTIYRVYRG